MLEAEQKIPFDTHDRDGNLLGEPGLGGKKVHEYEINQENLNADTALKLIANWDVNSYDVEKDTISFKIGNIVCVFDGVNISTQESNLDKNTSAIIKSLNAVILKYQYFVQRTAPEEFARSMYMNTDQNPMHWKD